VEVRDFHDRGIGPRSSQGQKKNVQPMKRTAKEKHQFLRKKEGLIVLFKGETASKG